MTQTDALQAPADRTGASPARLQRQVSRLLSQLCTRSDRLINEGLAEADARKWHYAVLASLQEQGPASQSELSRRSGIFRSDMVSVLNELVERDFVQRVPDPCDRRRNVVSISPEGSRHLRHLDVVLDDLQARLLEPLSVTERGQLVGMLSRLLDHHSGPE